jgi:serine protease Do
MKTRFRCRPNRGGSRPIALAILAGLAASATLLAQPAPPAPPAPPATIQIFGSGTYLGVGVADIDSERARELKLKEERGVEITWVEQDSPAEKAGIQKGDVVLDYNGTRVEGIEQFVRLVKETPAGRTARITVSRGGSTQTLTATIATRQGKASARVFRGFDIPSVDVWIPDIPRAFTSWRSSMLGIEAEGVDGQRAEFFGVKEGVLVRSVAKGTPAEKAGLKAGDVVTKVDSKEVSTPRELSSALRAARSRQTLPLTVMRDKRETTVNVTLEERSGAGAPSRRVTRQEFEEF